MKLCVSINQGNDRPGDGQRVVELIEKEDTIVNENLLAQHGKLRAKELESVKFFNTIGNGR